MDTNLSSWGLVLSNSDAVAFSFTYHSTNFAVPNLAHKTTSDLHVILEEFECISPCLVTENYTDTVRVKIGL